MDLLEELGIEKEKIKTVGYYLNPKYNWDKNHGSYQDGYRLEQTLEVKLDDFEKASEVISQATAVGVNVVGSLSFEVDDLEAVKAEAREEAIQVAKDKADQIAEVSGLNLGKLMNYYEYSDSFYGKGGGMAVAESRVFEIDEGMPSVEIEPGEKEVTLNVTLTYRIK